jgi:hypothetical protein
MMIDTFIRRLIAASLVAGVACGGSVSAPGTSTPERDAAVMAPFDATPPEAAMPSSDAAMPPRDAVPPEAVMPSMDAAMPPVDVTTESYEAGAPESDARVGVDGDSASEMPDGEVCVSACATSNPEGRATFDLVAVSCMCADCSDACKASTCGAHALPQGPCVACVQQSLANECARNGYLDQFCGAGECQAYLNCVTRCPS